MLRRVPLGKYAPDLPPQVNPGLTIAKNCVPRIMGYGPLGSFQSLSVGSLTLFCRGAYGTVDSAGNAMNFAGDANSLYISDNTRNLTDIRKAGGYNAGGSGRWEFAEFGGTIFACQIGDPIQKWDVGDATFTDLSADAPLARHMAVINNFLMVGNTIDDIDGAVPNRIWWPAIGNPTSWPTPGTDAATSVQSDFSDLPGDGGWVQALVSGAEIGAIFQEKAIWRADYVGGDIVFELNRVAGDRGLLIPGLAVPFQRRVFYLAEDGFHIFDYAKTEPVGEDRVNRTFLNDLDISNAHRVFTASDPDSTNIFVLYPGIGNTGGLPNKLLIYNWTTDNFSTAEIELECIARVYAKGSNLDSLPDENIDTAGGSFDERESDFGARRIGGYDSSHVLGSLSGTPLDAVFETGDLEFEHNRHTMVMGARPLVDGQEPSIQISSRNRRIDFNEWGETRVTEQDGMAPFRQDGIYHRFRLNVPGGQNGFTEAYGIDVEFRVNGRR